MELNDSRRKKFVHAAWVFTAMNLAYLVITYLVLPPMGLDPVQMTGYSLLVLVLSGGVSWLIARGGRKLVMSLALIYFARAGYSAYTLMLGSAFPIVPWVLPTIIVTFYFLGRAAWDWP